ncbi:kinase-like domain, phloem protein 2-like protein [Tanacetum coccineum]
MFELLRRRKVAVAEDQDNKYLASVAVNHYREKKLNEIIDWDLWNQMDSQSFNTFAEIAYDCLNEERSERPNIDEIVTRLAKALELARENRPVFQEKKLDNIIDKDLLKQMDLHSFYMFAEIAYDCLDEEQSRRPHIGDIVPRLAKALELARENRPIGGFGIGDTRTALVVGELSDIMLGVGAETIIYKCSYRGRLENYLSDPMLLTWVKRLEISVAVAHALRYIHYDEPRDFTVIHRNMSSNTILLNDDWEPKLFEFQHSVKTKASERHHSFHTDSVWSKKGYTDPTCADTVSVNLKLDIYSFGIILFELLCGRKSVSDDQDNKHLAPMAIFHYKEKILDGIIDPDLWKQIDPRSLNIFAETAYECLNEEQSQRPNMDEIVTRLEKALELQLECENAEHSSVVDGVGGTSSSHDEGSTSHSISTGIEYQFSKKTMSSLNYLSHSQLSYEDIQSATKNWARGNIISEKTVERVYQGRMLHSGQFMDIVARRIYPIFQKDMIKKFRMEKLMLSSLNHTNLVSAIGFPNKYNHMLIVYKKEANGSLNTYLSDQTLTWIQRLKICLGVANALCYIHYDTGRDFSVIHCNIRSSKILLDDKWEPKLSGFQLALKNTVPRRHRLLLTRDVTENVYVDPKYKKTGGMTHKSDVYSFGVVLLEILCGRSAVFPYEKLGEGLLSKLVKSNLDDMIDPHLRKQMHPESLKLFSETAYCCVKEERADRPYIDQVVKTNV